MAEEPGKAPEKTPEPEREPDKTLTQADVDRVVQDRLQRERAKYADYDTLKMKASQFDELQEAQASDLEKAVKKAASDARKEAQQEFDRERRGDRLRVAVAKRARELADVDDVVLNLERGEVDGLFNNEGVVDDDALGSTLNDLLERKPHLKADPSAKPLGDADAGKGGDEPVTKDPSAQHNEALLGLLGLQPNQ